MYPRFLPTKNPQLASTSHRGKGDTVDASGMAVETAHFFAALDIPQPRVIRSAMPRLPGGGPGKCAGRFGGDSPVAKNAWRPIAEPSMPNEAFRQRHLQFRHTCIRHLGAAKIQNLQALESRKLLQSNVRDLGTVEV